MKLPTFFIFILVVTISSAAVFVGAPNKNAKPGTCETSLYGLGVLSVGDLKSIPGMCMRARCDYGGVIQYEGCSVVDLQQGCKFIEPYPNAPFPDCCKVDVTCDGF